MRTNSIHPMVLWGRERGMNQGVTAAHFKMSRPTWSRICRGGLPSGQHMRIILRKTKGELTFETFEKYARAAQNHEK